MKTDNSAEQPLHGSQGSSPPARHEHLNLGGRLTAAFIDNRTTLLLMIAALLFGLFALMVTPREENPQITVPAVNVILSMPGASAQEIENLLASPTERLLGGIKGMEHVYSVSYPDFAVVTAQFLVGEDQELSVFKVYNQIYSHMDRLPAGVQPPIVRPVDVNDVPIVALTIFSAERSSYELRRAAERIEQMLREVQGTSSSSIVGGDSREISIEIDPLRAAAFGLSASGIAMALQGANARQRASGLEEGSERLLVQSGRFLLSAEDVGDVVLTASPGGMPIYIRDIAEVSDGPGLPDNFSRMSFSPSLHEGADAEHGSAVRFSGEPFELAGRSFNAVTIAVAKYRGSNAVEVAEGVISRMDSLAEAMLPDNSAYVVTRDDGEGANHAVNELITHLTWAILIVLALLVAALGWRDAAVVALAIPLTLLVTLGVGYLAGQSINRITLFALILSLGLLVDDAIVVVENIHRHLKMRPRDRSVIATCITAVNEISSPTIYATLTVVLSMVPMAFVSGMMGPYMAPIPFNVPVAMVVSLLVAFTVTPYLALRWVRVKPADDHAGGADHSLNPRLLALYRRMLQPLMHSRRRRNILFGTLVLALLLSFGLPLLQLVKFRMLPKADKNTFLVTIDMPSSANLAATDRLVRELEDRLLEHPELSSLVTTVGTGSVIDFNGLLRGTSFRSEPYQADIRVNLRPKQVRRASSESIVLELRPQLSELAARENAVLKLVEDPPGPPVRATVLAEIYGPYGEAQRSAVKEVRAMFSRTGGVVDIDDSVRSAARQLLVEVDQEKAARAGLQVADVSAALSSALDGFPATVLHDASGTSQVPVVLRYPASHASRAADLMQITLPAAGGNVPLSEITRITESGSDLPIHHKDLKQVSYVQGEMARRSSVYAVIDLMRELHKQPLDAPFELAWEGEWDLTLKVFRDLGLAMGVAIVLIYLLMVARFHSFTDPLVILGAVPLTMLGVLPGFALLGSFEIYFSATGMIGVIALAGIVVRNSIILIEFIKDSVREGMPLEEAVVLAGVIRTRPILLTALAAIAGMLVVVSDPVWSGLSWALLFGILASTSLSLVLIPLLYYVAHSHDKAGAIEAGAQQH